MSIKAFFNPLSARISTGFGQKKPDISKTIKMPFFPSISLHSNFYYNQPCFELGNERTKPLFKICYNIFLYKIY